MGFFCSGGSMADLDSTYMLKKDCEDVPRARSNKRVARGLSVRRWRNSFNEEGQLNIANIIGRVQKGGVHPSIRGEVWEFLLGCYSPLSSRAERERLRNIRRKQYTDIKMECQRYDSAVGSGTVITAPRINEDGSPLEQVPNDETYVANHSRRDEEATFGSYANGQQQGCVDKRVIQWKLVLHQIGLDVVRTDRMLQFYENPANLSKLWDILAVYAWLDEEVGYCQGMSDLCSPMVVLFTDEADAFWCFKCMMYRVRENFRCTDKAVGVQQQLGVLAQTMQVLDPKLHNCLEVLGGGSYVFAFRMLMVIFRREFSFPDALFLWEVMWALEYNPEFVLHIQQTAFEIGEIVTDEKQVALGTTKVVYKNSGKFVRRNMKYGSSRSEDKNASIAVFCVAGILEMQRKKIIKGAPSLDEVVKILNDTTGKLNAATACKRALKLHKTYLIKVKKAN